MLPPLPNLFHYRKPELSISFLWFPLVAFLEILSVVKLVTQLRLVKHCHLRDFLSQSPMGRILRDCLTRSKTPLSQNNKISISSVIPFEITIWLTKSDSFVWFTRVQWDGTITWTRWSVHYLVTSNVRVPTVCWVLCNMLEHSGKYDRYSHVILRTGFKHHDYQRAAW